MRGIPKDGSESEFAHRMAVELGHERGGSHVPTTPQSSAPGRYLVGIFEQVGRSIQIGVYPIAAGAVV